MTYKIKVSNQNGVFVPVPTSAPSVISSGIINLDNYSNTAQMLANVTTSYTNAVSYIDNLTISEISDVVLSIPVILNNSTLVYNTSNNKFVVKELNLDGGNF